MNFRIAYKIKNVMQLPDVGDVFLDGVIGIRYERSIYERVTSKFAIDMILREAEEFFADQYDDEFLYGMWRSEFWGKLMLSAARVCRMQRDEQLKQDIRASVYKVLQYQDADGYLSTYKEKDCIFRVDPAEAEKICRFGKRSEVCPPLRPVSAFPIGAGACHHIVNGSRKSFRVFCFPHDHDIDELIHFPEAHVTPSSLGRV